MPKYTARFSQMLLISSLVLLPAVTVASDAVLPDAGSPVECSFLPQAFCTNSLIDFISSIANWMIGIYGALFVLMVIVSGVQMASAGDNPDRIKAAKKRLINAIIGLVLLISFRAILALFGIVVGV